jgi:hypothetical protein
MNGFKVQSGFKVGSLNPLGSWVLAYIYRREPVNLNRLVGVNGVRHPPVKGNLFNGNGQILVTEQKAFLVRRVRKVL